MGHVPQLSGPYCTRFRRPNKRALAARKFKRMYRVAGLIGKSVSRRAWCRDHMHLQKPPLPASTSRADMLRLNRETAVLLLASQTGIRQGSRLENKPRRQLNVQPSGAEKNR